MSDDKKYLKIQKKIRLQKSVFIHFGIYVIVILFLFAMNWLTNDHPHDDWWFLFPAISWGMAVAIHALTVFGFSTVGVFGEDWEAKKIEEELERKGLKIEQKQALSDREIDIDQQLDLKELEKKANYDEGDLV